MAVGRLKDEGELQNRDQRAQERRENRPGLVWRRRIMVGQ